MKCRNCEYPLWNLASRKCPECGTPFLPCEYEFVPNSVQFCCPHCNQPYYGTDEETGHLVPCEFDCVSCGKQIDMNDCVLRPTQGVSDEQTRPDDMPWLERKHTKKRIRAFFTTIGRGMTAPTRLMRTLDDNDSRPWSAIWFALIIQVLAFIFGLVGVFLVIGFVAAAGAGARGTGFVIGGFVFLTIVIMFCWCIFVFLWAGIAHILVGLTGKNHRSYGHTVEAISYASSANVLTAIPCLGMYMIPFALVWWSVTAVLAVRERRQISGWRASLAVLPFPALILIVITSLSLWSVSSTMTMSRRFSTMQQPKNQLNEVYSALQNYQYQYPDASYPQHAAELFRADLVDPIFTNGFVSYLAVSPDSIPVGSGTLADVIDMNLDTTEIQQYIQESIDDLPDQVSAYRFGEMVITWNGLDPSDSSHPQLWLAVLKSTSTSPARADLIANDPTWQPSDMAYALQADGTVIPLPTTVISVGSKVQQSSGAVITVPNSIFSIELKLQNELRASLNLPPIPDPDTVTYQSPATGILPPPASDDK